MEMSENLYKKCFYWLIGILLFAMPIMSLDFGISGDEHIHHVQAEYAWDYFLEGDTTALDQPKTLLHYYGQSFDFIVVGLEKLFDVEAKYELRHACNSLTGWLAILFAGLIGVVLGGYRLGLFASILLFVSPRFIGHAMNNPMDMPFTTGYIAAVYFIIALFKSYPKLNYWSLLGLILSIGFTISIRVGGILLIPITFMYGGLYYLLTSYKDKNWFKHLKIALWVILATVAGYFVGLICWPYALQNPLENPLIALEKLTNIDVAINQLFDGKLVKSNKLPSEYLTTMMYYTIPLVVLLGIFVYPIQVIIRYKKFNLNEFLLVFTAVFPVFWVIYKGSNIYGGWRHLLFVYPSFVVLAAFTWDILFKKATLKSAKYLLTALFVILVGLPSVWAIKNYPHHYVYYNEVIGGVDKAYKKYEIDYYYRSIKQAADWLVEEEKVGEMDKSIVIATNHYHIARYYFKDMANVTVKYVRYYERSKGDWDYAIITNNYISGYQLKRKLFPPKGTIHKVSVGKVPLTIVIKRPDDKSDYHATALLGKNKFREAIPYFKKHLQYDPKSEQSLANLGFSYMGLGQNDSALVYANQSLKYHSNYIKALDVKGRAYLNKKEFDKCINQYKAITKIKNNYHLAYYFVGWAHFHKGNYKEAIKMANTSLAYKGIKDNNRILAFAYQKLGDNKKYQEYLTILRK